MRRAPTRCPNPCCRTGCVPDDVRQEAMAVYFPLARRDDPAEVLLLYPVTLLRWVIGPFSEHWRREMSLSCPFADQHLSQAVLWLLACLAVAVVLGGMGIAATVLTWTQAPWAAPAAGALAFGAVCVAPVAWLLGHVVGMYRASEGHWAGPPLVGALVAQTGSARLQPPKASSRAPATAIET